MRLSDKQHLFAKTITKLEVWLERRGIKYVRGEAFRSPEEAKRLASIGRGIVNSNHCKKLAQDLILFDETGNPWNPDTYKAAADYWLTLHPWCRAGYYFKGNGRGPGRDSPHFSFIHNGVQ